MGRPDLFFPFLKGDLGGPNLRKASIDRHWDRALRSFLGIFFFLFLAVDLPTLLQAEAAPNTELENVLQKIESRHYRWIAIRANVLLFFAKAGDPSAMCGGELLYQRLDERMFLTCVDAKQELLFVFRTFDRRFDLYLPGQKTVYHGSIFDMEDSPDIESHLKARDLYRALKPTAVDPRRAQIERTNSAITSLDVYGQNDRADQLMRKLYLTPDGDVRGELFYGPKGQPVTEIQRYDFRKLQNPAGPRGPVIFPKKITILSPETKKGSAIFFTRVTPLDTIDPLEFILRVPPGTKEVFLDKEDSRAQPSSASKSATPRLPKAGRSSLPTPEKAPKNPEPSLRSPQAAASVTLPGPKESSEKKVLPASPKEKTSDPEKLRTEQSSHEDPDADLVPEDSASAPPVSSTDPQTTLDPSVAPSLEMKSS